MSMRQPINNEMETRLIHPEEAHYESSGAQYVRIIDPNPRRSIKSPTILKTDPICSHEIKIDKSYRPLDSDDNHAGLIVGALVASTIFTLFAIGTLPSPFASISGKRSESSLNLDSLLRALSFQKGRSFFPYTARLFKRIVRLAQLSQGSNISSSSAPSEIICGAAPQLHQ